MESDVLKMDSIELIGSTVATLYNHTGRMYFFKYRIKRSSDWKIGISGMQPLDPAKVDVDYAVVSLTEKKLKLQDPIQPQLDAQLKKLLYSYHKSAKYFYGAEEGDYRFSGDGDN
jgi:hypothetical protein